MATAAQINVRIGGDIRELNKALRDAEKSLKTAGQRLSDMSRELSLKLTLPMLAFGAASIKAAGEIEALNKSMDATFKGAGRTLGEARQEVNELRKAAEAPGLDFEQAVKASLRLQGVGFSAERARDIIKQFANAVATAGGTAESLNRVTVQLAQIQSKGKILNEDLMILKENMPGLSQEMIKAFGTADAEGLRKLGISTDEFISKLTTQLTELPRVEGGISNAIVNAGVAIKTFLASVGESLNKTFNISQKLEQFSTWLGGLADGFSKMSEGQQKAIAGLGVFAIALGPMIKVGQGAVFVVAKMYEGFLLLQKALLESLAGKAIPSAIAAFKALDTATKMTIVGAAIGVVLALGAAFYSLSESTDAATMSKKRLAEINVTAEQSISQERVSTGLLVDVLRSNTSTLDQKRDAIAKLNAISPEYFKGLNAEAVNLEVLNRGYGAYIENLLRAARAKVATEKLIAIDQQRSEKLAKRSQLQNTTSGERMAMAMTGQTPDTLIKQIDKEIEGLNAQENQIKNVIQANTEWANVTNKTAENQKKAGESIASLNDKVKTLQQSYENATIGSKEYYQLKKELSAASAALDKATKTEKKGVDELATSYAALDKASKVNKEEKAAVKSFRAQGNLAPIDTLDLIPEQTKPQESGPNLMAQRMQEVVEATNQYNKELKQAASGNDALMSKINTLVSTAVPGFDKMSNAVQDWANNAGKKAQSVLGAVENVFSQLTSLSSATTNKKIEDLDREMNARLELVKGNADAEEAIRADFEQRKYAIEAAGAKKRKRLSVIQGVINAAQGTLKGLADGGIVGAIIAAAIGAVQLAIISKQSYAKGTNNAPGGLSLVGEFGPELVNLPKGSQVTPNSKTMSMLNQMNSGASNINLNGEFRIAGSDLLLTVRRAEANARRGG
jgi:tape measure domain-containing protein